MPKRLFETLDIMNQNDTVNKTATVCVYNQMIEAKKAKGGGHVTMGVELKTVSDLFFDEDKIPILIIVDRKEYEKIKNQI